MAREARIREWSEELTTFIEATKIAPDLVVRRLGFEGFRNCLLRSPVDTGRFRASWRIAINRISTEVAAPRKRRKKKSTPGVVRGQPLGSNEESRTRILNKAKFGDVINITNSLPYALRLENGYSVRQAPLGVLRLAFDDLRGEFSSTVAAVRRSLKL